MSKKDKTLNNKEAMEALLAGKKVRDVEWTEDSYVYIDNDQICSANGLGAIYIGGDGEYAIFEAPKQKVVKTFYQHISCVCLYIHQNNLAQACYKN